MILLSTNNTQEDFFSFCLTNNLDYEKDEVDRAIFDEISYNKLKNHPEIAIKYIDKGGLLVGGSTQKGCIQIGYERKRELVVVSANSEITNHQFISSVINARAHVKRAMDLNDEINEEPTQKEIIIPRNCPKIVLDNTKFCLIVLSKRGERFFFSASATAKNLNKILKLEKDIHYRLILVRSLFILIIALILLEFLDFI